MNESYMEQRFIKHLNLLDTSTFTSKLGHLYEASSWVVERAYSSMPYKDVEAIFHALRQSVAEASRAEQLALIRAHPDLAGKAARADEVTEDSRQEQRGAGLDQLSEAEYQRFHELNEAYKAKFEFPFILAVKGHDKRSILRSFEQRLSNHPEQELRRALSEIDRIAAFRLQALIASQDD